MTESTQYVAEKRDPAVNHRQIEGLWSTNGLLNIWPYQIIRITLAFIFLWSGITKLFDPVSFVVIIDAYGLIPDSFNMPVAMSLAALEAIVGVTLFFDIRGSLAIVTLLLSLFIAILGYGIWLGLDIDCGCFGPEDPEAKAYHGLRPALYRDIIMIGGVAYLYCRHYRRHVRPVSIFQWINRINDKRKK